MKCSEIHRALTGYADRRLDPGEARSVEEHLAGCPDCRALLSGLRTDMELLRAEPEPEMPAGLAERIGVRIRQGAGWQVGNGKRETAGVLQRVMVPVAMAVVVVVGIWVGIAVGREVAGPERGLRARFLAAGLPTGDEL
jgi:anti-sigma factor RsiW